MKTIEGGSQTECIKAEMAPVDWIRKEGELGQPSGNRVSGI